MRLQDSHAAEVHRLADLLATAIRQKGVRRDALEDKLALRRGELTELLSGSDLRLGELLRLLEALELHPWHFFRVAFNRPRPRAGSESAPGAEEELVVSLREAGAAAEPDFNESAERREGEPPAAEGSGGQDPARGARGSS